MKSDQASSSLAEQRSKQLYPVYANVYNFWNWFNCCCKCFGIGVYHTGIQFFQHQYMYFGFDGEESGVGYIEPRSAAYEFSEQILLGYTEMTYYEIDQKILEPLQYQFIGMYIKYHSYFNHLGNRYDLLNFNCNHFALRTAKMLQLQQKFPKKVFTVTDFFNQCRCCLPECILNGRLDWFNFNKEEEYSEIKESMHVSFKSEAKQ